MNYPRPRDLWPQNPGHCELSIKGLIAHQGRKFSAYHAVYLDRLRRAQRAHPLLRVFQSLVQARQTDVQSHPDRIYAVFGVIQELRQSKSYRIMKLVDATGILHISCRKGTTGDSYLVTGSPLGFLVRARVGKRMAETGTTLGQLIERMNNRVVYDVVQILYAEPIICPDRNPLGAGIAILGDIHVGSRTHLETDFLSFIQWVNSRLDIRYLLCVGDSLDGRNVYPGHDQGLKIRSIQGQCHALGKMLGSLREDIRVVMIMGNHQGVGTRREPQIWPHAMRQIFSSYRSDILYASNPGFIAIGEYRFLLYHGASADPLIARCEALSYQEPTTIGELQLKYRNLCPVSDKIPILPTERIYHLIPPDTDYLITGHIHRRGRRRMPGGTTIVSAGTWQHLTPFQARLGFQPDYAVVDVIYPGEPDRDFMLSFKSQHTDRFRYEQLH